MCVGCLTCAVECATDTTMRIVDTVQCYTGGYTTIFADCYMVCVASVPALWCAALDCCSQMLMLGFMVYGV